ncbi:hypothetical protein [Comamonas testosteroni]|uniref:hypothetical protein n=1 Tax=Comamonas testosteroni TaxID=285 RepID=UPI000B04A961|nr:hypothetical protein [Comamonas testosteroni]
MAQRNRIPVAWMKIYDPAGNYKASCVDYAEAAVLVSFLGNGSQVRNGHGKKNVIWHEGHEDQSAGESYDRATAVMASRMMTHDPEFTPEQIAANERAQQGLEQARETARQMMAGAHENKNGFACTPIGLNRKSAS